MHLQKNFIGRTFGGAAEVCLKIETVNVPSLTFVTGLVKHFFEFGRMLHDEEVVSGQARASPARARAVRTFRDVLVGSVIIHWGIIRAFKDIFQSLTCCVGK